MYVVVQSRCCVSSISDIRHKKHSMDRTYMNLQLENTHVCAWECMSKVQGNPGSGVLQFRDFVTRTKSKKKKSYFLTCIVWLEFCIILIKKKP